VRLVASQEELSSMESVTALVTAPSFFTREVKCLAACLNVHGFSQCANAAETFGIFLTYLVRDRTATRCEALVPFCVARMWE
jgi:hypothetical protein